MVKLSYMVNIRYNICVCKCICANIEYILYSVYYTCNDTSLEDSIYIAMHCIIYNGISSY